MKSDLKLNPVGAEVKPVVETPVETVVEDTVNSTETEQLETSTDTEAPINTQDELANTSAQSENTEGTEPTEEQTSGVTKHIVTYIGGGHWIGSDGKVWARESMSGTDIKNIREYDDEDFKSREDLKFMIGYGAMTVTTVTL
jgi:hypothetical protein